MMPLNTGFIWIIGCGYATGGNFSNKYYFREFTVDPTTRYKQFGAISSIDYYSDYFGVTISNNDKTVSVYDHAGAGVTGFNVIYAT